MRVKYFLIETGQIALLLSKMVRGMFSPPLKAKRIIAQMVEIGINTLPIAAIMAIFTGMVLAVQTYYQFKKVGMEMYIGTVVGASMCMELGPVLTAIIVAGRVGSSTAAELGTMKITEQIDALRTMAVDPVKYLAVPRLWAALIMLPILTIFTDFIGMFGGYVMGVYRYGIKSALYIDRTTWFLVPWDMLNGLVKSVFFGIIIVVIGCHKGFVAQGGAEGVGKATTSAVVTASILILVFDYFLTVLLFINRG
ncbi:MAG: ABC transporter permease [bacterium]|nr:ABC transporter permease [bacterium]